MASNTGIPYERLCQEIFQEILAQDFVRTIDVQHNITLQGKTATHQIDVYWEFEVGGVRYATVLQAKDWATSVMQGELLKFREVLNDLPSQPRGIMVTRKGYQRGAADYAHAHGILLYELAENPTPERDKLKVVVTMNDYVSLKVLPLAYPDSPDTMAGIRMDWVVSTPKNCNLVMHIDKEWAKMIQEEFGPAALTDAMAIPLPRSMREVIFCDETGSPQNSLYDVCTETVRDMTNTGELQRETTITFDIPTFVNIASAVLPLLKLVSFSVAIEIAVRVEQGFGLPNFVEFVLKNLNDGTARRFRRPRIHTPVPR